MRRGEIRWMRIPGEKKRPAVILSSDFLNDVRDRVLVCWLSDTSQRVEVTRTEVLLDAAAFPKPTKVQCQDMATLFIEDIGEMIRPLSAKELLALDQAIAVATGLWR